MALISVHKALSEKKLIPARIDKLLRDTPFVLANRNTNTKIAGASIEDTEKNIRAAKDAIWALMARHKEILFAIAASNSTTKVTICGKEMTVTEAIQLKKYMEEPRKVHRKMRNDNMMAVNKVAMENDTVMERAAKFAKDNTGDKSTVAKPEQLTGLIDVFVKANEFSLIDPLSAQALLATFEDEILAFESEVDAKLSESNALTMIEVSTDIPVK